MFKIIKGTETLATVATPTWIKVQENGCYGLSNEAEAHGIVLEGTVYHLAGRDAMDGVEDVTLTEISEAAYLEEQRAEQEARQLQTESAIAELSILIATMGGASNV